MTENKRYGKKVDDVDDTIINITEDGNDFAWFLSDDYTDEQVDKIVQRLNEQNETIQRLEAQLSHIEYRFTEYRNKVGKND